MLFGCLIIRWGMPARCARMVHIAAGPSPTRSAPAHAQLNPTVILSPLARKLFCGACSPVCCRIPVRESLERCVLMCPCFWMFVCAVCVWVVLNDASVRADCFSAHITTHHMDLIFGPVFVGTYLLNSLFCADCLTVCSLPNFPPPGLCHASRWQSHFCCRTGPTQRKYPFKRLFAVVDGRVSVPVAATQHEVPRCRA